MMKFPVGERVDCWHNDNEMSSYLLILLAAAYFCGSIPFGKLIGRWRGIDIQRRGSGNIGFANVRRVLGLRAGLLTLTGDVMKGLLPTVLAQLWFGEAAAFWTGLLAIAGHVFPVWLKFRGGKGIATGLGMVIALQPVAAVVGVAVYGCGLVLKKSSGMSSIIGVGCLVLTGCVLMPHLWWQYASMLVIALWTLRKNIAGTVPNYDV